MAETCFVVGSQLVFVLVFDPPDGHLFKSATVWVRAGTESGLRGDHLNSVSWVYPELTQEVPRG